MLAFVRIEYRIHRIAKVKLMRVASSGLAALALITVVVIAPLLVIEDGDQRVGAQSCQMQQR